MNNKGFTMVEILVVIVLLSIVMMIVYPTINDTLFSTRKSISKINLKNIEESAEIFAQDVHICDPSSNILSIIKNDLKYSSVTNCQQARDRLEQGMTVPLKVLIDYQYIDKANKCNGNIIIKTKENKLSDIEINSSDVKCEK